MVEKIWGSCMHGQTTKIILAYLCQAAAISDGPDQGLDYVYRLWFGLQILPACPLCCLQIVYVPYTELFKTYSQIVDCPVHTAQKVPFHDRSFDNLVFTPCTKPCSVRVQYDVFDARQIRSIFIPESSKILKGQCQSLLDFRNS